MILGVALYAKRGPGEPVNVPYFLGRGPRNYEAGDKMWSIFGYSQLGQF